MPSGAKEKSASGLSTFIRHYIRVLGHASRTGYLEEAIRLSDGNCEGCSRYIAIFRDTYEAGGTLRQRWSAPGESVVRFDPRSGAESFVTTDLKISAGTYRPSAEEQSRQVKGTTNRVTFSVRFDGEWIVTQFGLGDYE